MNQVHPMPRRGFSLYELLVTITIASTAGLVIPFVLSRLDLDPALATGPFLTTMNDVVGISVYLLAAYLILF